MGPQMISPDFVDDALACLRRQGLPTEAVLRAAGLPAAVRGPSRRSSTAGCGSRSPVRSTTNSSKPRARCGAAASRCCAMRCCTPARSTRRCGARCSSCAWCWTSRMALIVADGRGADRADADGRALPGVRVPDVLADPPWRRVLADRPAHPAAAHRLRVPEAPASAATITSSSACPCISTGPTAGSRSTPHTSRCRRSAPSRR